MDDPRHQVHPAFASHEGARARFHRAQRDLSEATQVALLAGERYLAHPFDAQAERAYREAARAEQEAAERLAQARAALMDGRRAAQR